MIKYSKVPLITIIFPHDPAFVLCLLSKELGILSARKTGVRLYALNPTGMLDIGIVLDIVDRKSIYYEHKNEKNELVNEQNKDAPKINVIIKRNSLYRGSNSGPYAY